jgi:hypothetical protein
MHNED